MAARGFIMIIFKCNGNGQVNRERVAVKFPTLSGWGIYGNTVKSFIN
jgi:hypothetical protein